MYDVVLTSIHQLALRLGFEPRKCFTTGWLSLELPESNGSYLPLVLTAICLTVRLSQNIYFNFSFFIRL